MRSLLFLLIPLLLAGEDYVVSGDKAYLLNEHELRIITSEGSRKLPVFGDPVGILTGSRPYVVTSEAVFAVNPSAEQITTAFRLDKPYTDAVIGAGDRIYLLGADMLSVIQGSAERMSFLYTYALPRVPDKVYRLASGSLLFTPISGTSGFTFNPANKKVTDVTFPWTPSKPLMAGSVVVDKTENGLRTFRMSTRSAGSIELGAAPSRIVSWQDKVIAVTPSELILTDPLTSVILSRTSLASVNKLSAVDSDSLAVSLSGNDLITFGLPSLAVIDTFNASCTGNASSSAYPLFSQPLLVCGDKLAVPGGTATTSDFLVKEVKTEEGKFFALQVGALSNPMNFGPLLESIARHGLPHYTVEAGDLTKFRVGFFRTREEADRIRTYLADIGPWIVVEERAFQLTQSIHDINHDGRRTDGIVAKGDSVLFLTLKERTWIEVIKEAKLAEPVTEVYLKGNHAYARLQESGLRELVLTDSAQ